MIEPEHFITHIDDVVDVLIDLQDVVLAKEYNLNCFKEYKQFYNSKPKTKFVMEDSVSWHNLTLQYDTALDYVNYQIENYKR